MSFVFKIKVNEEWVEVAESELSDGQFVRRYDSLGGYAEYGYLIPVIEIV